MLKHIEERRVVSHGAQDGRYVGISSYFHNSDPYFQFSAQYAITGYVEEDQQKRVEAGAWEEQARTCTAWIVFSDFLLVEMRCIHDSEATSASRLHFLILLRSRLSRVGSLTLSLRRNVYATANLPGDSGLDQLEKIWLICRLPSQQNWPGYDTPWMWRPDTLSASGASHQASGKCSKNQKTMRGSVAFSR